MPADLGSLLLLALAAFAAGAVNSVAGGGTLLTFPALTAFVTADIANATSTLALLPGSLSGAWAYRNESKKNLRWIFLLIGPSLIGGLLGAVLVVQYPKQFEVLIPWLILIAAILFTIQPFVSKLINRRKNSSDPNLPPTSTSTPAPTPTLPTPNTTAAFSTSTAIGVTIFQFAIALYGGYFGAGIGILMLASLGLLPLGNIHQTNGVKTILASTINIASVVVFLFTPKMIHWRYVAVMAVASIIGGFMGAHFARKLPASYIRWVVIAIGFTLACFYFVRNYAKQ